MTKQVSEVIESNKDIVLQEDLEGIANSALPFEVLKGANVFITGATGLVGSMIVKALACCNRRHNLGMTILGLVRSVEKATNVLGELVDREDVKLSD